MQIHGSCGSRGDAGVLLIGPPGSGKSDLLLRLLDHGFAVVADDQVIIEDGIARPPPSLAGLLEIRGLGIVRVAHVATTRLALLVELADTIAPTLDRLPEPSRHGRPARCPARVFRAARPMTEAGARSRPR